MNYPIIAREGYPIIFSVCAAAIILLAGGRIASGGGPSF